MKTLIKSIVLFMVLCLSVLVGAAAGKAVISVDADKRGVLVSPMLYSIFFEEINRAGDGGLVAEMVENIFKRTRSSHLAGNYLL